MSVSFFSSDFWMIFCPGILKKKKHFFSIPTGVLVPYGSQTPDFIQQTRLCPVLRISANIFQKWACKIVTAKETACRCQGCCEWLILKRLTHPTHEWNWSKYHMPPKAIDYSFCFHPESALIFFSIFLSCFH